MSKDIAIIIWEMAKREENFEKTALKGIFKVRYQEDAKKLKKELQEYVENCIRKFNQLTLTRFDVPYDLAGYLEFSQICDDVATEDVRKSQYSYYDGKKKSWILISNEQAKRLIDVAIIPLDLKWSMESVISYRDRKNVIRVTWDHWKK